jgi:hypothetical protein
VADGGGVGLPGSLVFPGQALGLVIFAHGSGSSRRRPRNQFVAAALNAVPVERRTETGDAARQPSWSSSSSRGLAAARHSPTAPVLAAKTAANR